MAETIAIYIYEGEYGHGTAGYGLIERAARDYLARFPEALSRRSAEGPLGAVRPEDLSFTIEKEEKKKPHFRDLPLFFSVSNSGRLWVCAVGVRELGLDVQKTDDREETVAKVSRRFYAEGEQKRVRELGRSAFYEIWVRKEAVGKLSGRGVFGPAAAVCDEEGNLQDWLFPESAAGDGTVSADLPASASGAFAIRLQEIPMPAGFTGACCWEQSLTEAEPEIRIRPLEID